MYDRILLVRYYIKNFYIKEDIMRINLENEKCRMRDYVWKKKLDMSQFKSNWKKDKSDNGVLLVKLSHA
jgi:predicted RNA-binding protein